MRFEEKKFGAYDIKGFIAENGMVIKEDYLEYLNKINYKVYKDIADFEYSISPRAVNVDNIDNIDNITGRLNCIYCCREFSDAVKFVENYSA